MLDGFDDKAAGYVFAFLTAMGGMITYIIKTARDTAKAEGRAADPLDAIRSELHAIRADLASSRERREEMHDEIKALTETVTQLRISVAGLPGAAKSGARRT